MRIDHFGLNSTVYRLLNGFTFSRIYGQNAINCPPSLSSQLDVATDNLLDFEDSVNVAVETNGNIEEDQWDNHRPPETNNNPAWVRLSSSSHGIIINSSFISLNVFDRFWNI